MFTIQYVAANGERKMQSFDSRSRRQLVRHLSSFERPICAVYEQVTVITKAVQKELADLPPSTLSRAAKDFVKDGILLASCPE